MYSHPQQREGRHSLPPCSCNCCYSGTMNKKKKKTQSVNDFQWIEWATPFSQQTSVTHTNCHILNICINPFLHLHSRILPLCCYCYSLRSMREAWPIQASVMRICSGYSALMGWQLRICLHHKAKYQDAVAGY